MGRQMRAMALSLCTAALALGACGPQTGSGVSYDRKSRSDIGEVCQSNLAVTIDVYRMRKQISKRQERTIIRECCRPAEREAGRLSALQRAWLWYRWKGNDDINQSRNELNRLQEVEDALRGDMNVAEYTAAASIQSTAQICAARAADRL